MVSLLVSMKIWKGQLTTLVVNVSLHVSMEISKGQSTTMGV
jgi:hypothetical protein